MSIKSAIQTLINTKLASASSITAVEHREVVTEILENGYGTVISETHLVNSKTAPSGGFRIYNINIVKQMRCVEVIGYLQSALAGSVANINFIDILDSELAQATLNTKVYFSGFSTINGMRIDMELIGNKIKIISPIALNHGVYFQFKYFTLN